MNRNEQFAAMGRALQQMLLASFGLHPEALEREVADAVRHLGAEDACVLLCDYAQEVLVAYSNDDHRTYDLDDSLPGHAFRTNEIVAEQLGHGRRRLWIPVRDSSEREGVLCVVDDGSIADDIWSAVASLVGELVASKEKYGDHITMRKRSAPFSLSAEMRWGLLPPLTYSCPDVTIAGVVRPSHLIAGDAFDYAVTGRTAFVAVFDAMGHGLEASRMANLAVGTYRNGRRNGNDIIGTLREADSVIADQFGDSRFVTAQLAALDLDTGEMTIANAGHPRPLLLQKGTGVDEVPCPPSQPVGLGCEPSVISVTLESGDAVIFRTDGVADARSPSGELFADERLADLVRTLFDQGLPPSEVVRQAMHAVAAHKGERAGDDATLVLVLWTRAKEAGSGNDEMRVAELVPEVALGE